MKIETVTNSQYDQFTVGLIAQLVEHCTGIVEVMGSNPVQAWSFFRRCVYNCDNQYVFFFDLASFTRSAKSIFFQAIIHFTIDNAIIQEFGACLAQNIGSRAALTQNGS